MEEKIIEEEVAKRVEELVAKRVEEELEKRKDEIEAEVLRRVEEAKRIMEKQMLEEMEKQREAELVAQRQKEVQTTSCFTHRRPWQVFRHHDRFRRSIDHRSSMIRGYFHPTHLPRFLLSLLRFASLICSSIYLSVTFQGSEIMIIFPGSPIVSS